MPPVEATPAVRYPLSPPLGVAPPAADCAAVARQACPTARPGIPTMVKGPSAVVVLTQELWNPSRAQSVVSPDQHDGSPNRQPAPRYPPTSPSAASRAEI